VYKNIQSPHFEETDRTDHVLRIMLNWRYLLAILILSLITGIAGSWFATWQAHQDIVQRSVLRGSVLEIANRSLSLSGEQQTAIREIEAGYRQRLQGIRDQIKNDNQEIARALFQEQTAGPRVAAALDKLKEALRSQELEAVLYVLEVRKLLSPSQQAIFDRNVAEVWELSSP
jgi:Heavy-metal resistance